MTLFSQTRRHMLLGLAAAATTATATSATGPTTGPKESPELLALADKLEPISQAQRDALAARDVIVKEWGPQWPVAPREIIWYGAGSKKHADITGAGIATEWSKSGLTRVQNLGTPEGFAASRDSHLREYERRNALPSKRGAMQFKTLADRDAALIEPARAYWAEVERITEVSGYEAARTRAEAAALALKEIVGAIVMFEERTIAGLVIKAQAMQAWSYAPLFQRALDLDVTKWADAMTATIIRQAGGAG